MVRMVSSCCFLQSFVTCVCALGMCVFWICIPKSNLRSVSFFLSSIIDKPVETEVNKIVKQKQKFERMVVTKEEALELFADNPFKVEILTTKVPDNTRTTVYKCGNLIDLCRGPHMIHTGKVKGFSITRHSATNWLGDTDNDSLQRMYGISFPDKKMLKIWKENQEKVRLLQSFPYRFCPVCTKRKQTTQRPIKRKLLMKKY